MIQYLQRLKHKKGFTLVELAVVVGIIAVLTAIIMVNMLGGDTEKILKANSNAQTFFTASPDNAHPRAPHRAPDR